MDTFEAMRGAVRAQTEKRRVAVAAAQDEAVLAAVHAAQAEGFIQAVLVGDGGAIRMVCGRLGIDAADFEIVNAGADVAAQCAKAVALVLAGGADVLMKGLVETPVLLRAVLAEKARMLAGPLISHLAVFEAAAYPKLLFLADSAVVIAPSLEQKQGILRNALPVVRKFGIPAPRVACLCAKEHADEKMPATLDAAQLQRLAGQGAFGACEVSGPMAMDVAVSESAAAHKGIAGPVAGNADLLLAPSIEAGNILYKALVLLAGCAAAGIVTGLRCPMVLTSRSDGEQAKLDSIIFAAFAAGEGV